jgi:MFS transporter, ACS family, tartrate transporter
VKCGSSEIGRETVRKVSLRLLPFLFVLYVIAYLDRVNFGYAALQMNSELGISAEIFGFLSGIFFIGYLLFEVPSNLILQRVGARVWIARIMVSWGIVVILTAAASSAFELAAFRFILGIAEAGFFPGIILYLTCWFRKEELARAVAFFMAALTISNIIGAPVSTWILDNISWFGIAGWRWLFILEGVPAIILGVATYFYLTDRPEDASWLSGEERDWLCGEIARGNQVPEQRGLSDTLRSVFVDRNIWHLGLIYCMVTIGLYGTGFWMPQIIRSLNPQFTNVEIGLLMMIPFAAALVAMTLWSAHSDRTGERRWHTAVPAAVGGIALIGAGIVPNPLVAFLLLVLATVGIFCFFGPFWTLPAAFLAGTGAAAGIAVINSVGNIGGFLGPTILGFAVQITGSTGTGLVIIGSCLVLCSFLTAILNVSPGQE